MNKHDFPRIHFYEQDFVDIYNKTWSWVAPYWINPTTGEQDVDGYFIYPENQKLIIGQFESIFSSFFLPFCSSGGITASPMSGSIKIAFFF